MGETSRSIQERSKEHWSSYRRGKEDSHMVKHQWLEHGGEPADFVMRVVGSCSTALNRQISEAVRIRRRGGEGRILNSKAEYNRSHIPRLQLEEEDKVKKREEEMKKEEDRRNKLLEVEQQGWEQDRTRERDRERQHLAGELRSKLSLEGGIKKGGKRPKEQETRQL